MRLSFTFIFATTRRLSTWRLADCAVAAQPQIRWKLLFPSNNEKEELKPLHFVALCSTCNVLYWNYYTYIVFIGWSKMYIVLRGRSSSCFDNLVPKYLRPFLASLVLVMSLLFCITWGWDHCYAVPGFPSSFVLPPGFRRARLWSHSYIFCGKW